MTFARFTPTAASIPRIWTHPGGEIPSANGTTELWSWIRWALTIRPGSTTRTPAHRSAAHHRTLPPRGPRYAATRPHNRRSQGLHEVVGSEQGLHAQTLGHWRR